MKNAFKLSGALLLLYATCAAEFEVGNGALQLDTSVSGVYDSNLRDSIDNVSDYYLNLQPTLRYRRLGARFQTNASVGMQFRRYLDNPGLNTDNANARFDWNMARAEGRTTGADLSLAYFENSEPVIEVNDLVRTKTFVGNTSGEVLVAGRNLLSAGFTYRDSQRDIGSNQTTATERLGYSYVGFTDGSALSFNYAHQQNNSTSNTTGADVLDQTGDTGSVSLAHPIYAELTGSVTYGYRWLDRGDQEAALGLSDQSGSFYAVNLDGPFLPKKYFPKTTGTFRIGYEQAQSPGLNDKSNERLVGQVDVSWKARERTTVHFFASRSQDLSINDNTIVNESTGLSVGQAIGSFIDTDFGVTYTNADFVNLVRIDDRYEAHASATYKINRVWSSALAYRFLRSDSTQRVANFERHVVTGTVTYAF